MKERERRQVAAEFERAARLTAIFGANLGGSSEQASAIVDDTNAAIAKAIAKAMAEHDEMLKLRLRVRRLEVRDCIAEFEQAYPDPEHPPALRTFGFAEALALATNDTGGDAYLRCGRDVNYRSLRDGLSGAWKTLIPTFAVKSTEWREVVRGKFRYRPDGWVEVKP